MTKIHNNICPICNHSEFSDYLVCKDYYASKEDFQLIECKKCGFVLTQDFPSENEIGKYYHVPDYVSHSDTKKGLINRLYHIARSMALKSKAKIINKYSGKDEGMLLDIGCGTGYFLDQMRGEGWAVTGVEKDEGARKFAKEKFDLNTQEHNYVLQLLKGSKDVITMWHVLEHIENLDLMMNRLHDILREDGLLVIALPNCHSLDAQAYEQYWAAYDVPRHLWHFSPDNFELLANKYNFKLVDKKPMYFDAFYISMLSEKYKGSFIASLRGLIKGFSFFLRSRSNVDTCSSITYILKKK